MKANDIVSFKGKEYTVTSVIGTVAVLKDGKNAIAVSVRDLDGAKAEPKPKTAKKTTKKK